MSLCQDFEFDKIDKTWFGYILNLQISQSKEKGVKEK